MIKETVSALKAFFIEKQFHQFDPHVGETSCQIRALQVLHWHETLQQQYSTQLVSQLLSQLQQASKVLLIELSKVDVNKKGFHRRALSDFLRDRRIDLGLPTDILLITQMYFLSKYKFFDKNEVTYLDVKKIKRVMNISNWMTKRLVHNFQTNIAEQSCYFIEMLSACVGIDPSVADLVSHLRKCDDDNRQVLPYFLVMKILLANIAAENKCILFVVNRSVKGRDEADRLALLFSYNGEAFVPITEKLHLFSKKPVFVVKGRVEYTAKLESKKAFKTRLLETGIIDVMLANAAAHPQYSGKKLAEYQNNPYEGSAIEPEFLMAKEMGETLGCCKESADLFFITHILSDSVAHQLELMASFSSMKEKLARLFTRSKSAVLI